MNTPETKQPVPRADWVVAGGGGIYTDLIPPEVLVQFELNGNSVRVVEVFPDGKITVELDELVLMDMPAPRPNYG